MQDSAKYLIHADIHADGVVERSDVVGAIFGQTEGLLGDDLDLRDLQEASKVGRIDVQIDSEAGRSYGTVTIASGLDRVETAVLAAGLETIDRVGPCRSEFEVTELEDARAAKRREVVERATDLLTSFEESALSSRELVEQVRQNVRVEDVTEYEGLPAGPRVAESDAIIVVEGRADVLRLLQYGIKNAIAVEGTDVPDVIADLTQDRTVTAFFDGDRGGDLILKELAQVGTVDYVAFAPSSASVEDLSRDEVMSALRKKAPYDQIADASSPRAETDHSEMHTSSSEGVATDSETGDDTDAESDLSSATVSPTTEQTGTPPPEQTAGGVESASSTDSGTVDAATETGRPVEETDTDGTAPAEKAVSTSEGAGVTVESGTNAGATSAGQTDVEPADAVTEEETETATDSPETLAGHVDAVIENGLEEVRLLDDSFTTIAEAPADEAFDAIADASEVPAAVILDGELSQRELDVAAQRGVPQIITKSKGEFVKQPANVRVRTATEM